MQQDSCNGRSCGGGPLRGMPFGPAYQLLSSHRLTCLQQLKVSGLHRAPIADKDAKCVQMLLKAGLVVFLGGMHH